MCAYSRENIVDEIKSRCNIVDVVGRVVSLKKAGSNYKGLCPFHNEKTPSFVVSEGKQIFSCFGCNATGDVIEFVQRHYNLEFQGAIEKLADEYGIDVKEAFYKGPQKEALYEINREAAKFFYRAFAKPENPANAYMKKRGISPDILKRFGIGYADGEWDSLYKHFTELGTDTATLLSLGLISESKGKYYDKFRDRVIFPIINTGGKVIGFGGRAIGDGTPKYLNSAESAVFLKKNNLFGLNLTRQDISKENKAVLVEGYMDVISLYQAGVRNVSASLGTALTENQARLLKRYTTNIVLAYDADEAGQAAALRGVEILHQEGCKARVLSVSEGKDPDEFIRKRGKDAFTKLIDEALPYADFRLHLLKRKYDMSTTEGKLDYIKDAVSVLRALSPAAAEAYIKVIARDTKISEAAITLEYNGNNTKQIRIAGKEKKTSSAEGHSGAISVLEKNLLKLIATEVEYLEKITPYEYAFQSKTGNEIFLSMKTLLQQGKEADIKSILDSLDEAAGLTFKDVLDNVILAGKEEQVFADCVNAIEQQALTNKAQEIMLRLSMVDEVENNENIEKLTIELMNIQKEIQRKKNDQEGNR